LSSDSFSAAQFSLSMPSTNRLGSKVGLLTKASTSPVLGSSATIAPRRSPYKSSISFCSLMSIASTDAANRWAVSALWRRRWIITSNWPSSNFASGVRTIGPP
jgi:hypothetical protein